VKPKTAAITPPEVIERVLSQAGDDVVLVGGQALGFWVQSYGLGVPEGFAAISNDLDFLAKSAGDKESVQRFASIIKGHTIIPSDRALTALVGQAVLDISDDEFINIDVIFKVIGIKPELIRSRAVRVQDGKSAFLVMHPLDVLHSRLANIHQLVDKKDTPKKEAKSLMQLAMGINIAREFLRAEASRLDTTDKNTAIGRSPIQGYVSAIEKLATGDAGRKIAQRHGLHVADAIDPSLIPAGPFWEKRWPGLQKMMSPAYAASFKPPAPAEAATTRARPVRRRNS